MNNMEKKRLEDEKKANLVVKSALDAEKKKAFQAQKDTAVSDKPVWEKKADTDKILATCTISKSALLIYSILMNTRWLKLCWLIVSEYVQGSTKVCEI